MTDTPLPNLERLVSTFLQADVAMLASPAGGRTYTALPSSPQWPLVRVNQYDEINVTSDPLWVVSGILQIEAWGGSNDEAVSVARVAQAALAARLVGVHGDGVVTAVRLSGLRNEPDREFSPAKPRRLFRVAVTAHP
jgi:hypothetical protein